MHLSLSEAVAQLKAAKHVLLSTHANPDGDGLGAESALFHYLRKHGKTVTILNPDPLPTRYEFLDSLGEFAVYENSKPPTTPPDLFVVVDTGDYRRLKSLWQYIEDVQPKVLFLDHHPQLPDEKPPLGGKSDLLQVHDVIDEASSSIGELLYRLFVEWEGSSFRLSKEIALGLYVSIMTDTNSFRYARTTALSHRIAAELVEFGVEPEEIYQNIYSTKTVDHLRLIGSVLAKVKECRDGKIAWVEIPWADQKKNSASGDELQNIVNFLMLLREPEVLVLLRELEDGRIRASLKSKGRVVVNTLAAEFTGGGHAFAAGFTVKGTMREIAEKLIGRLESLV